MSKEIEIRDDMTPAFVFRKRNIPAGTEVEVNIGGKDWEYPGDRLFVVAEYPCFILLEVLTSKKNRYKTTIHKADLYTGHVKLTEKGGMAYA